MASLVNLDEGVTRARVESRVGRVCISASIVTPKAPFLRPPPLPRARRKP